VGDIGLNSMENSSLCHATPALTNIRKKNSDVQLVAASHDFPKSLR
jgi:hypothetical protein